MIIVSGKYVYSIKKLKILEDGYIIRYKRRSKPNFLARLFGASHTVWKNHTVTEYEYNSVFDEVAVERFLFTEREVAAYLAIRGILWEK